MSLQTYKTEHAIKAPQGCNLYALKKTGIHNETSRWSKTCLYGERPDRNGTGAAALATAVLTFLAALFVMLWTAATVFRIDAFAAWRLDDTGYYWQNTDGSYPAGGWAWLDGNEDGVAECYYFDAAGYLLTSGTTPDGYTVNEGGAWTVNGAVQTRKTGLSKDSESGARSVLLGTMTFGFSDSLKHLEAQSDGSYLISNRSGTQMARLQLTDLDSSASLKKVLDVGQKMGLSFDSAEMRKILTDAFAGSMTASYGAPDSITEESYPSGIWERLHYNSMEADGDSAEVDILLHFTERKVYHVIMVSFEGENDVADYMNNYVR